MEVSSWIMWMRFGCEKWVFVSTYGPGSQRSNEKRESFWEELNTCIRGFEASENVVVLGNLNARVGDRVLDGATGKFRVLRILMKMVRYC